MIIVDECNIWDKYGTKCHETVRNRRYFDGCDVDQVKDYLLTEASVRLNLDITKVVAILAFTQK